MMDLNKTTVLPNGFSCLTVNFIIQKLKFCKVAQFLFVSFSFERKSEKIERKFTKKHNPNPSCSCADGSEVKTKFGRRNTLLKRIASICGK